jgi:hypothetical protein
MMLVNRVVGVFREGDFVSAKACHESLRICRKLVESRSVSGSNRSFSQIPVFSRARSRHVSDSLRGGFSPSFGAERGREVSGSEFFGGKPGRQAVTPLQGIAPSVEERVVAEGKVPRLGPA